MFTQVAGLSDDVDADPLGCEHALSANTVTVVEQAAPVGAPQEQRQACWSSK
jgi:hypothetical protein